MIIWKIRSAVKRWEGTEHDSMRNVRWNYATMIFKSISLLHTLRLRFLGALNVWISASNGIDDLRLSTTNQFSGVPRIIRGNSCHFRLMRTCCTTRENTSRRFIISFEISIEKAYARDKAITTRADKSIRSHVLTTTDRINLSPAIIAPLNLRSDIFLALHKDPIWHDSNLTCSAAHRVDFMINVLSFEVSS